MGIMKGSLLGLALVLSSGVLAQKADSLAEDAKTPYGQFQAEMQRLGIGTNAVTWATNAGGRVSYTVRCANEAERVRVRDVLLELNGGVNSTKDPPTVSGVLAGALRSRSVAETAHGPNHAKAVSGGEASDGRTNTARAIQPGASGSEPAQVVLDDRLSSDKGKLCAEILEEYHKNHTYIQGGVYECVEMATDVWNILKTRDIEAKVMVGNVEHDIGSLSEADHAWVIAEISPGKELALECTGGFVVPPNTNRRYYSGHPFTNPRDLRDYQNLARDYNEKVSKAKSAAADYNELVDRYNQAYWYAKQSLEGELRLKKAVLDERSADVAEVKQKLDALVSGR